MMNLSDRISCVYGSMMKAVGLVGQTTCLLLVACCFCFGLVRAASRQGITLENNGYRGVLISIHSDVTESQALLDAIKDQFTKASKILYKATRKRAFFKEITILVPPNWSDRPDYGKVSTESHQRAQVVIETPSGGGTHGLPYTKTFRGCGKPGKLINIPPDFFLNPALYVKTLGPQAKVLVHEWAHLRWGLFDEYGDEPNYEFYFSNLRETQEATRCTSQIKGEIIKCLLPDIKCSICRNVDPITGTYDTGCKFYPFLSSPQSGVTGSFMYRQYVNEIVEFCDNDPSNPSTLHNVEAPSKQNRLCNHRSSWEVMLTTDDFKRNRNPARHLDERDLVPTFRIVKDKMHPLVLVVDVSGSMQSGEKFIRLRQAAEFLIRNAGNNSEIGIVEFSALSNILSSLRVINSEEDRELLLASLPSVPGGATSIGSGLRSAMNLLRHKHDDISGSELVLLTDGVENTDPLVETVLPDVLEEGVIVHSFAFTESADSHMRMLAETTGGMFFFDRNQGDSVALMEGFVDLTKRTQNNDPDGQIQMLFVKSKVLYSEELWQEVVTADRADGRNLLIWVAYSRFMQPKHVTITSPSGYVVELKSCEHEKDFYSIRCSVPDPAEPGEWTISVQNPKVFIGQKITITVTSTARRDDAETVLVETELSTTKTTWPPDLVIYAEVTRGGRPVLGMDVKAEIQRPFKEPLVLQLRDDGNGGDVTKYDGVYSRYFTDVTGTGRYGVSIKAMPPPNGTVVMKTTKFYPSAPEKVDPDNPVLPPIIKIERYELVQMNASRVVTPGAFEVKDGTSRKVTKPLSLDKWLERMPDGHKDKMSPARITDLMAIKTSEKNSTVRLQWTATGDDFDQGTATKYEIYTGNSFQHLYKNSSRANLVSPEQILEGNLSAPSIAGEMEHVTIQVRRVGGVKSTHAFKVRAVDDAGNVGEFSNIVSVGLGSVPDLYRHIRAVFDMAENSTSIEASYQALESKIAEQNTHKFRGLEFYPYNPAGLLLGLFFPIIVLVVLVAIFHYRKTGSLTASCSYIYQQTNTSDLDPVTPDVANTV
ncbi:calcium-activated chloride channel regulator 4-like [Tubulanus polymorphus]|uniref:calcium-activated chloride channel regulator 4-like n=1 Tax=Tubulanus polymorphus TaxID=672921 RepID=UPI003DA64F52